MTTEEIKSMDTRQLEQRSKLNAFALAIVCIGALTAVSAVVYRYITDEVLPLTTLILAILAVLAAIPVWTNNRLIQQEIETRAN